MALKHSNYIKNRAQERNNQTKNGFSLFLPIPSRNCVEAKIPEELCSCDKTINVNLKNKNVVEGAEFLVDYVNNVLLKDYQDLCIQLNLQSILMAKQFSNYQRKYSVIFTTSPNNATFDATFVRNGLNLFQSKFKLIGNINRISLYGLTSKCIDNYFLKNYCYCY